MTLTLREVVIIGDVIETLVDLVFGCTVSPVWLPRTGRKHGKEFADALLA